MTSTTDDNVQRVREVLNSDRRLSVRMAADEIGIDTMTVHRIITETMAIVPKVLTNEQEQSVCLRRPSATR